MEAVERLPGNKHVEVWVTGAFTLIHNHYHVPRVAVHEVNPEVDEICLLLSTDLYREP